MQNISPKFMLENMFLQITYAAERKCTPDWKLQGKTIYDRHNFILVYDGEAELICNKKKFTISRGDLVYYRPGDYRLGTTPPGNLMKCYTVDFFYTHLALQNETWQLLNAPLPFDTLETITDPSLYSRIIYLFSNFIKMWFCSDYDRIIRAKSIFLEILSLLLHWKTNSDFNFHHIRKIESIIHFMSENYTEKLTLQNLADHIHMSPTYMESTFKKVTGKSPINYLVNIHIQKAKEFLHDGHTVSETALKVGFNDIFYFSKCFKNHEGISPSKFLDS